MAFEALALYGDLQIGPLNSSGVLQYYLHPMNATKLTLKQGKVEIQQRKGTGRTNWGATLNAWAQAKEGDVFTIEQDRFNAELLAVQLRGDYSTVSVTGASVTDEDVVAVELDQWIPLAHDHVTAAAVTEKTSALVEDTDFVVNRRTGQVKFLSGKDAVKGTTYELSYAYSTHSYGQVTGPKNVPGWWAVQLDGINAANNNANCKLIIPRAIIATGGDLDLITEKAMTGKLEITPVLATGQTAPYYYREDN